MGAAAHLDKACASELSLELMFDETSIASLAVSIAPEMEMVRVNLKCRFGISDTAQTHSLKSAVRTVFFPETLRR